MWNIKGNKKKKMADEEGKVVEGVESEKEGSSMKYKRKANRHKKMECKVCFKLCEEG